MIAMKVLVFMFGFPDLDVHRIRMLSSREPCCSCCRRFHCDDVAKTRNWTDVVLTMVSCLSSNGSSRSL